MLSVGAVPAILSRNPRPQCSAPRMLWGLHVTSPLLSNQHSSKSLQSKHSRWARVCQADYRSAVPLGRHPRSHGEHLDGCSLNHNTPRISHPRTDHPAQSSVFAVSRTSPHQTTIATRDTRVLETAICRITYPILPARRLPIVTSDLSGLHANPRAFGADLSPQPPTSTMQEAALIVRENDCKSGGIGN